MGLDFLRNNGARRVHNYAEQPFLLTDSTPQSEELDTEKVKLEYEDLPQLWEAKNIDTTSVPKDWQYRPKCFVDGKDMGRTIAWLQSKQGHPVPVRLSQIGAVVMRNYDGTLVREFAKVEQVVSVAVDFFPWDEVESFAVALRRAGLRLLTCQPSNTFDFERMRITTQNRSMDEMTRLERLALTQINDLPTVVDGLLGTRSPSFDPENSPVVGLIKTLRNIQLHDEGWRVLYSLQPRQRTPAFRIVEKDLSVISWYLRLDGFRGELPNYGIVRLEISEDFFKKNLGGNDWQHLDYLSQIICDYRCRDSSYDRASVSLHPIQRAEESLGALFTNSDTLINHFYRITGL